MTTPVITAVTAWVPDTIPLSRWYAIESTLRGNGHRDWDAWMRSWHPDYGHWLEAWPGEEIDELRPMHSGLATPSMTCMVPVEAGTGLSGLAAKMAKEICAARRPDAPPVDVIVFCHSSLDENVSATVAGRLCVDVGTPCFPFSISQQHGVSPFTALRLAADLFIAEPDVHTILIIAAEMWRPPFSRTGGSGIVHGDAAGALLVERASHGAGGLQLLDAEARHVPVDIPRRVAGEPDALAFTLLSMIETLFARHALHHRDIDEILGPPGIPLLTDAVCDLVGRPDTGVQHEHCVHLGAAESIVQLAQALRRPSCYRTHRILLWGYGIGGFVGTVLLQAGNAPLLCQQNDVRSVP